MTDTSAKTHGGSRPPTISTHAGGPIVQRFSYTVATATEFTAAADRILVGYIPAQHLPTDAFLRVADIDSGGSPAVLLTMGMDDADGAGTADHDAFILSSSIGQAGGIARADNPALFDVAPTNTDRAVYIRCATPPQTDQAGVMEGWFSYVPVGRDD